MGWPDADGWPVMQGPLRAVNRVILTGASTTSGPLRRSDILRGNQHVSNAHEETGAVERKHLTPKNNRPKPASQFKRNDRGSAGHQIDNTKAVFGRCLFASTFG
jgi:hypothetical protein